MFRSPDQLAKQMRIRVFQHMLRTRGWKYKVFLRQLRLFKYLAFAPVRGTFLEYYYTLMRYLDDVVDGDAPLPKPYSNPIKFLQEKIDFAKHTLKPQDEVDHLMLYCFELADRFSANFQDETEDILYSLLFDAKRRGKLIIFPQTELTRHFHLMDIRGTIRATLKVFREDPEKYVLLEPLGMASRYQFDLEDLDTDIEAGYINISKEECERFEITLEDLKNLDALPIQQWRRNRAKEGMALLEKHHENLEKSKFPLLARLAFSYVYEYPARKQFRKVIHETRNLKQEEPYETEHP